MNMWCLRDIGRDIWDRETTKVDGNKKCLKNEGKRPSPRRAPNWVEADLPQDAVIVVVAVVVCFGASSGPSAAGRVQNTQFCVGKHSTFAL